ncbi:uroporphyrinogen decarboxylase family protein [Desulfosporosinus fructosivorans]
MKKIERILATIRHERVDRVPKGEFYLEDEFVAKLLGLKENIQFKDRVEACDLLGLDALAFSPYSFRECKAPVWDELKQWRKETDFFIFAIIDGPFQGTAKLFSSFSEFLVAIAKSDPIILELAATVVAANVQLGLEALNLGANGLIIADDIAYQRGTFISPDHLRKNFFPGLTEQVGILEAQKSPIFFHADGNIIPVLSDIIAAGINGIHSLDFSSFADIAIVKKASENNLCLMGGYDLGWFSEENRTEKAAELLAVASGGGGYIFGSSAGILGSQLPVKQVTEVYQYVSNLDSIVASKP